MFGNFRDSIKVAAVVAVSREKESGVEARTLINDYDRVVADKRNKAYIYGRVYGTREKY